MNWLADNFVWIYLLAAFVVANLPWLSERLFFVVPLTQGKSAWWRLLEWLVLYLIMGAIGFGLEWKVTGGTHAQDWEFYAVTFSLFLVFAFPGFIWRYDLSRYFRRRGER